jgi:predicted lipid-binding transport protein (Tim44 family)
MGWLVSALIALLVVSLLAIAAPTIFGPVVAGVAPLLVVTALIGLGAVWWRHSRSRIDPDRPDEPHEDEPEPLQAEDDRVET